MGQQGKPVSVAKGALALASLEMHAAHFMCDLSEDQEVAALADLQSVLAECERLRSVLRVTLDLAERHLTPHARRCWPRARLLPRAGKGNDEPEA